MKGTEPSEVHKNRKICFHTTYFGNPQWFAIRMFTIKNTKLNTGTQNKRGKIVGYRLNEVHCVTHTITGREDSTQRVS